MDRLKDFLIPFIFALIANFIIIFIFAACKINVGPFGGFIIGVIDMIIAMELYDAYKKQ